MADFSEEHIKHLWVELTQAAGVAAAASADAAVMQMNQAMGNGVMLVNNGKFWEWVWPTG